MFYLTPFVIWCKKALLPNGHTQGTPLHEDGLCISFETGSVQHQVLTCYLANYKNNSFFSHYFFKFTCLIIFFFSILLLLLWIVTSQERRNKMFFSSPAFHNVIFKQEISKLTASFDRTIKAEAQMRFLAYLTAA